MNLNNKTSQEEIEEVEKVLGVIFPADYKDFLLENNGGEGEVGLKSYLILWSIQETVELNEAYEVKEFAPGLLLIGSDGGETAYAFDMRINEKPIVEVPFIGMDINSISFCAKSFYQFIKYIYHL